VLGKSGEEVRIDNRSSANVDSGFGDPKLFFRYRHFFIALKWFLSIN